MAEYIEKQAVIDEIDEEIQEFPECEYALEFAKRWIKKIHTADVRPVRRGMWVPVITSAFILPTYECSRCEFDTGTHRVNFCPNCGADMRGDEIGKMG